MEFILQVLTVVILTAALTVAITLIILDRRRHD